MKSIAFRFMKIKSYILLLLATSLFMSSVKAAVKVVAEKNKLDLVVPSNDVLYTKDNTDITQDVLKDIK